MISHTQLYTLNALLASVYISMFKQVSQVAVGIKNMPANAGDIGDMISAPGLGRCAGGGHGNPLQFCCLENPLDNGAWRAPVHRVTKSWI